MGLHLCLAPACGPAQPNATAPTDVLVPVFTPPKDAGTTDAAVDGPRDATATDAAADATPVQADVAADAGPAPDAAADAPDTAAPDAEPVDVEPDSGPSACGDATCAADESCNDCPADCGDCPAGCGDGTCKDGETCKDCPKDCGACPCGDGTCKGGEDCLGCPADCGACPAICGDKSCAKSETCKTCPGDCGACKVVCGDETCSVESENCQNCAADCGKCPGVCDPLTSATCAAAEQCYVTQAPPACIPAGLLGLGAACNNLNECKKGLLCIGSTCRAICDTSGKGGAPACANNAACSGLVLDNKPIGYNLGACFGGATCNLLSNDGCGAGQMCVPFETGKECTKAGSLGANQVCKGNGDCAANMLCVVVGPGDQQQCKPRCHASGGNPGCSVGKCVTVVLDKTNKPAPDSLGVCN